MALGFQTTAASRSSVSDRLSGVHMPPPCGADGTCPVGPNSQTRRSINTAPQAQTNARLSGLNQRGIRQMKMSSQPPAAQNRNKQSVPTEMGAHTNKPPIPTVSTPITQQQDDARIEELQKIVAALKDEVESLKASAHSIPWKFGQNSDDDVYLIKKPSSKYKAVAVVQKGTWALLTVCPFKKTYWAVHVIDENGTTEVFYTAKRKSFTRFSSYPDDESDDAIKGSVERKKGEGGNSLDDSDDGDESGGVQSRAKRAVRTFVAPGPEDRNAAIGDGDEDDDDDSINIVSIARQ